MLHGHLDWLSLQLFALTAEGDNLLRFASLYGITPNPATFAQGAVIFTGVDGSAVPSNTLLGRDDGLQYKTPTGGVIVGGILILDVRAIAAGANGNLASGETLDVVSPPVGVDATATVATSGAGGPLQGGSDEETLEELRIRLIERLREPPAGGRDADYIAWAKLVTGVTRVWVFRHELGLGTVVVRFVRDNDLPSIIPDAGEVADVADAIEKFRPTTAEVTVLAPVDVPLPYTISILPADGIELADAQAAVSAALDDLHFRDAEPGDGAGSGTIRISQVLVTVGKAPGVEDYDVTVPAADTVPALGELLTRGTITWVPWP